MDIAVLVSGGVDSSVALRLLQEQGHRLTAYYLKIWLEDELAYLGTCPWEEDLAYAEAVCKQAAIPLEIVSLQKEYWDEVVAHTIAEVRAGRTPNPDILCNQRIKFGSFYKAIPSDRFVATGHYARVEHGNEGSSLHTTPDIVKDQTYFLSHVTQEQLSRALFPLGSLQKTEVRALAQQYDLPTKNRKDSQGICFLGKLKFREFVRHHIGDKEGALIEYETGKKVGIHQGFWYYTIGQRQGLGLAGGPWYVVSKDPQENIVFISRSYYTQDKMRDTLRVAGCNWIQGEPRTEHLLVKVRHGPAFHEAVVCAQADGTYGVTLATRDQGIAPGQYAVFYEGTRCLGGGVIL